MMVSLNLPTFPENSGKNIHDQKERMGVVEVSRREMEITTVEIRIRTALKAKLQPATNTT